MPKSVVWATPKLIPHNEKTPSYEGVLTHISWLLLASISGMVLLIERYLQTRFSAFLGRTRSIVVTGGLGTLKCFPGANNVNFATEFGNLSQDRHIVLVNGEEPTVNCRLNDLAGRRRDANRAICQQSKHRLMLRQNTDFTIERPGSYP